MADGIKMPARPPAIIKFSKHFLGPSKHVDSTASAVESPQDEDIPHASARIYRVVVSYFRITHSVISMRK